MRRLLLLAMLLIPLTGLAESIYRSTDAEGNVVFTDTPPPSGTTTDRIELQRTNTAEPPPVTQPAATETAETATEDASAASYKLTIISPDNETSFPMGPGNFNVSVQVTPALKKYEGLQLFMDGEPWGVPQRDTLWDLTNVFRGQHDITVGVVDKEGNTLAISPPVRVYVHRPSVNFNKPKVPPRPQPK